MADVLTINELLAWLDQANTPLGGLPEGVDVYVARQSLERNAIRAILEQHRDWKPTPDLCPECGTFLWRKEEREAIRAFVTRVGAKYTVEHPTVVVPEFMQPWWDALKELEKETNAGTND